MRERSIGVAIAAGRLPAAQDGPAGTWRIAAADLRAYAAQPRQPGGRPRVTPVTPPPPPREG